ncbi:MAG: SH3 domain-containing protein [Bacteroidota bacterium]
MKRLLHLSLGLLVGLAFIACDSTSQSDSEIQSTDTVATEAESKTVEDKAPEQVAPDLATTPSRFPIKNPLPDWPEKPNNTAGKLFPFDEAVRVSDLVDFRQQLYEATKRKNVEHLLQIIDPQIKCSFGGDSGKEDFVRMWQLDSLAAQSGIWQELEMVLSFGGAFIDPDNKLFIAPYQSVIDDFSDPFSEGVIIGTDVRLREQPSTNSKVLDALSWDKVSIVYENNAKEETIGSETHYWQKIKTAKGQTGYIWGKYLGYSAGYRAAFEKRGEQWKMVSFLAGD